MESIYSQARAIWDALNGASDETGERVLASPVLRYVFWGVWWGVLGILALIFGGQSSKFIYIDF